MGRRLRSLGDGPARRLSRWYGADLRRVGRVPGGTSGDDGRLRAEALTGEGAAAREIPVGEDEAGGGRVLVEQGAEASRERAGRRGRYPLARMRPGAGRVLAEQGVLVGGHGTATAFCVRGRVAGCYSADVTRRRAGPGRMAEGAAGWPRPSGCSMQGRRHGRYEMHGGSFRAEPVGGGAAPGGRSRPGGPGRRRRHRGNGDRARPARRSASGWSPRPATSTRRFERRW